MAAAQLRHQPFLIDYEVPTTGRSYIDPREELERARNNHTQRSADGGNVIWADFSPSHAKSSELYAVIAPDDAIQAEKAGARSGSRKARLASRLRMLKRLPENHDGEGASAPVPQSVDAALVFLSEISTSLAYGATLDDDGLAVFEFEDRPAGFFADITFCGDVHNSVVCYQRMRGRQSQVVEGKLASGDISTFLRKAGITT